MSLTRELEELKGFKDFLILDEQGKVLLRQTKGTGFSQGVLSGYLASVYSIADRTTMPFTSTIAEISFDGEGGSVLVMKGKDKYFMLLLEGTPSMGIARLKLRTLVDNYEQ